VKDKTVLYRATSEITETARECARLRKTSHESSKIRTGGLKTRSGCAPGDPTFYNLEAEIILALGAPTALPERGAEARGRWIRVTTRARGRGGGEVARGRGWTVRSIRGGGEARGGGPASWWAARRGRGSMDARAKVGRGSSFPRTLLFLLSGK
jgi:hypothetical protein